MMNIGEVSVSIPTDLIREILSRLPAKSIARFRCVSKPWESMIGHHSFTEMFLTISRARPRLIFTLEGPHGNWTIFSSTQPQNPYVSSCVVVADFHMRMSRNLGLCLEGHTSGLIYFTSLISKKCCHTTPMIFNPNTGKYAILPSLKRYRKAPCFLGFDPIDKKHKVLFMAYPSGPDSGKHRIMTLGESSWRKIKCPIYHNPLVEDYMSVRILCINGVLYYVADELDQDDIEYLLVCFDFMSETFKFIDAVCKHRQLINYKGKLDGISWKDVYAAKKHGLKFALWVLRDMEKQEWSQHVYTLWDDNIVIDANLLVIGMTCTGEIVMTSIQTSNPFYVFYFNPERETLQCVEIQVAKKYQREFENRGVYAFVDHVVEDHNVNDAELFKSSAIHEELNNTTKREKNYNYKDRHRKSMKKNKHLIRSRRPSQTHV